MHKKASPACELRKDGRASQASAPRHLHASAGLDAAPFDLERKPLALRTTRRAGAMEPRPDFDGHDGGWDRSPISAASPCATPESPSTSSGSKLRSAATSFVPGTICHTAAADTLDLFIKQGCAPAAGHDHGRLATPTAALTAVVTTSKTTSKRGNHQQAGEYMAVHAIHLHRCTLPPSAES